MPQSPGEFDHASSLLGMAFFTATGQGPPHQIYQDPSDPWCTFTYDNSIAPREDSSVMAGHAFSTSPSDPLGMSSTKSTPSGQLPPDPRQYQASLVCPRPQTERSGEAGRAPPSPTGSTPNTPFLTHSWTDSRPPSHVGTPLDNRPLTPQDPSSGVECPTRRTVEETPSIYEAHLPTPFDWHPQSFLKDSFDLATESVAQMSDDRFQLDDYQYLSCPEPVGQNGCQPSLDPRQLYIEDAIAEYNEAGRLMTLGFGIDSQVSRQTEDGSAHLPSTMKVETPSASGIIDSSRMDASQLSTSRIQEPTNPSSVPVPSSKPPSGAPTHSKYLTSAPQPPPFSLPTRMQLSDSSRYQCRYCKACFDSSAKCKKHEKKTHERPFPCIFSAYGCTGDAFRTQNEWARHIRVQHLRLEVWRCDLGDCEQYAQDQGDILPAIGRKSNEHGRKDLFLEHVRRIHSAQDVNYNRTQGEERKEYMKALAERHHHILRSLPPRSRCPCCPGKLWTDFDARLHHMARAMEQDADKRVFFHDDELEGWMIEQGLLEYLGGDQWRLEGADGKKGGRQARQRRISTIDVAATADAEIDADAEADDDEDYHVADQDTVMKEEDQARRQTHGAEDRGRQRNVRRQRKQRRRIHGKQEGRNEPQTQYNADNGNHPSSTCQMSLRSGSHTQN